MCGIFAYLGSQNAVKVCIEGIKKLEYRGYDSSGMALIDNHNLLIIKEVGKISLLEEKIKNLNLQANIAISHTRWATHGEPSVKNAHPHTDKGNYVAVVHNGVIENYEKIKYDFPFYPFQSETDTEVIPALVAKMYRGDLLSACLSSFSSLQGAFAIAIIHKDHPNTMVATAEKSPLVVGFNRVTKEIYVASDPSALAGVDLDLFFLKDRMVAILKKEQHPLFYSKEGVKIDLLASHSHLVKGNISKGIYPHFMLKEIFEQEFTSTNIIKKYIDESLMLPKFPQLDDASVDFSKIEHIIIVACGTSYNAALVAGYYFESLCRIETRVEVASEYRYKNLIILDNTLLIALSQSGETADTLSVVDEFKKRSVPIIALCNVEGSTLFREATASILLEAGPEIAVASTKTFTSQLMILFLLALFFCSRKEGRTFDLLRNMQEIEMIPKKIAHILEDHREIQRVAKKYSHFHDVYFLGRGTLYPLALEGALKLKEIAYVNAVGYAAGEMKHGPIALLDENVPSVILCGNEELEGKIISNLMESRARHSPILVAGFKNLEKDFVNYCSDALIIPHTTDLLSCILLAVVFQLFAYYIAKEKKLDIDQPKNLAKSVTVE